MVSARESEAGGLMMRGVRSRRWESGMGSLDTTGLIKFDVVPMVVRDSGFVLGMGKAGDGTDGHHEGPWDSFKEKTYLGDVLQWRLVGRICVAVGEAVVRCQVEG